MTFVAMPSEWQLRREICDIGRRIHTRWFVAGTDGNISARLGGDRFLITPSGSCLGMLNPNDLVVIDAKGKGLSGQGKPSSERWMHLAAYTERSDVMAAVHAHPPMTVALTVAGVAIPQCSLPEVILAFGQIPVTSYATPGTEEGAGVVRDLVKKYDALILDRHGSLTVGKSLMDAYLKLEKLEHGSQVLIAALQLGSPRTLPPEEVTKLAALREQFGLGSAEDIATQCFRPAR